MQIVPAPNQPGLFHLSGDDVPQSLGYSWDPLLKFWRQKLFTYDEAQERIRNPQPQPLESPPASAPLLSGVAVYPATFSATITVGSNLAALRWHWEITLANGKVITFPEHRLDGSDGSQIIDTYSVDRVTGVISMTLTPARHAIWGGLGPGSSWTDQCDLLLQTPTGASAAVTVTGGSAGTVTRTIASSPRYVSERPVDA